MPARNAFASASLDCVPKKGGGAFHVTLKVWSHSYDQADPQRRNALIKTVKLARLTGTQNPLSNVHITDRYGVDHTAFWPVEQGGAEVGFVSYTEVGPVFIGTTRINVIWGSTTGIYDERCWADPACDSMRLQTVRVGQDQIAVFNYLLGPVTFSFDIAQPVAPKAVKLVMGYISGNGGNPAQRGPALLDEEIFIIEFP
jgi:hypothetical protein